jgi:hypothetical protein
MSCRKTTNIMWHISLAVRCWLVIRCLLGLNFVRLVSMGEFAVSCHNKITISLHIEESWSNWEEILWSQANEGNVILHLLLKVSFFCRFFLRILNVHGINWTAWVRSGCLLDLKPSSWCHERSKFLRRICRRRRLWGVNAGWHYPRWLDSIEFPPNSITTLQYVEKW